MWSSVIIIWRLSGTGMLTKHHHYYHSLQWDSRGASLAAYLGTKKRRPPCCTTLSRLFSGSYAGVLTVGVFDDCFSSKLDRRMLKRKYLHSLRDLHLLSLWRGLMVRVSITVKSDFHADVVLVELLLSPLSFLLLRPHCGSCRLSLGWPYKSIFLTTTQSKSV